MARIFGFRRKHGPIPEFEEALARLSEEIVLTETFAEAMIREGNYKAAAAVVDEQRRRLTDHHVAMAGAFRPRARRAQVAIGGIAAVMIVGSASFAAFSLRAPAPDSAPAVIERVEANLDRAAITASDRDAERYVAAALDDLSAIGDDARRDPELGDEVEGITRRLGVLLQQRPHMSKFIDQIKQIAEQVNVKVDEPDAPAPPQPSKRPSSESTPQPPQAP